MSSKWFFGVLILVGIYAASASGREQGTTTPDPPTLDEVVVSATKTEEKRKDIPKSILLMEASDIEEMPVKSIGELLANEPGIDWRTYGDYGGAAETIQIRGMSANGTQVLVNGVNVASPSLGTADVSKIPLNSIERIEVVKGPGSLLYGSGAMGGTINIITKSPKRNTVDLKAGAGYGSQNTYQLAAENGMFFYDDFGYYLTAGRRETDGFRDNSDMTQNDLSLKLVLDKGGLLHASLYGDWIDREHGRPGVEPPDGTRTYSIGGVPFYNEETSNLLARESDDDRHLVLSLNSRPYTWLTLSARGDYTKMENYDLDRYVDFSGDLLGTKLWVTNTTYGLEANANVSFNKDGGILVGFDHKKYDWKNESIGLDGSGEDLPGPTSISEADLNTTGIYAEAQYRLCRYLKILGGIRQERHSTFGTETLPLVGAVLNPAEHTALKVSHGKHFLAPTPNDLFWPYQDFGFYSLKGNPDLKPETGYHSDITLEQGLFKDRIFATLSYYKWDVTDKIQWQSDSNWNYQPVNLDSFKGSGWEAGLRLGPYRDMNLSLSYTYTDAQEENEFVIRQAAYTPMHQFKGTVTHCSSFDLTTTFTARYMGKRYYYGSDKTIETPAGSLDSYWTADLKFSQRLFNNWRIELSGYNLFDKGYDTYLSPFTDYTTGETTLEGFPGAGRSLFLNIAYEF